VAAGGKVKSLIYSLASLLLLIGCGGGSQQIVTPPITPPNTPPTATGKLYVTNGSTNSILRFPAGAAGNVSPQTKVVPPETAPSSLALDVAHDRLAAMSFADAAIVVMDNASTTLSSARKITGPATTLRSPHQIAIDSANDLLYVINEDIVGTHILVFGPASTISGNVAPIHSFDPGNVPLTIALDSANNRLFVSTGLSIEIYDNASTLSGPVTPNRTISGPLTQINAPAGPLALDNAGHLIMATKNFPSTVLVFANAATANGNVVPATSSVIAVNAPTQLAVSPSGDLYVVDGNPALNVYSNIATASGNLTPSRVITGSNTGLDPPQSPLLIPALIIGVALDPTRNN
jgi:hypothetical protein